jgi:hypothetical protein
VAKRIEAQAALAHVLLEHVRRDRHPSSTQMSILEQVIPPQLVDEYIEILLEKVASDGTPSIPLLRRLQRVTDGL